MIQRSEVQRMAASLGVDPIVIDHDYALGWFLLQLAQHRDVRQHWIFKGGTSLAKCHFPEYRFSEDLDFTTTAELTEDGLREILQETCKLLQENSGLQTNVRPVSVDLYEDEQGRKSLEGKVYYQGIWVFRGDPRAVRIHLNWDEVILFQPLIKPIRHRYSDAASMQSQTIRTYTLEEVLIEKLRAFSGQRVYAIARDLFDLHYVSNEKIDKPEAFRLFPKKCRARGLDIENIDVHAIAAKEQKYALNWRDNLEYLLPQSLRIPFEKAWTTSIRLLEEASNQP